MKIIVLTVFLQVAPTIAVGGSSFKRHGDGFIGYANFRHYGFDPLGLGRKRGGPCAAACGASSLCGAVR